MRALLAILTAAGLAVLMSVGPPLAQTTGLNPFFTQTTLATAALQIIGQNSTRRSIRICNPGPTNAIWIWSGALSPAKSEFLLAPVTSNVITCFTPPADVSGAAGNQWNAIITGGSTGSAGVEEW